MRTCKGCRFIFTADVPDNGTVRAVEFCRGAPPTPIVSTRQEGQNTITTTVPFFPIVPQVRCGAFKRKWPWSSGT